MQLRADGHPDLMELAALYHEMLRIRRFEERILELFSEGKLHGTTHAYIGQEAIAVGVLSHLEPTDRVVSNHRCHGHFLMHRRDMTALLAELMGKANGVCSGRGGSQHLCRDGFFTNGVQGGTLSLAVGLALATRFKPGGLVAVFMGDGTLGEGQTYEAFNLASLWRLPLLFVIENNFYSQSTPSNLQVAGSIAARPRAFGIETLEVTSNRLEDCWRVAAQAVSDLRADGQPRALVFDTFRLCSHSKSDDGRPESVIEPWRERDPLLAVARQLASSQAAGIAQQVEAELESAVEASLAAPVAEKAILPALPWPQPTPRQPSSGRVVEVLNAALHELMAEDERVVLLGEDMLDPYGGAFKATRGLSTAYPTRVLATPLSETGFTGAAAGLALAGMRPIVEIMFGDFMTLCVDPLVNYVSKYREMYDDQVRCPLVVRTPMGGRRGYGPTHSQSLERLFLGIPELRIVALSALHDPRALLRTAVADLAPVLFIENKLLYTRRPRVADAQGWLDDFGWRESDHPYPTVTLSPTGFEPAQVSLITYGGMGEMVMEAAIGLLVEHEVRAEVVVVSCLQPLELAPIEASLARCGGRAVTVEEGPAGGGWGSEVLAACAEAGCLKAAQRVGSANIPIPSARPLEDQVLPSLDQIVAAARSVVSRR
ncbi:MAG: pyruvate dehydrogenase [Candidatus Eremiobacteraeota bacterium]|nr:pyruvate dehydrogenase [Candidatus Eremiobacteraeota bacterium]